MITESKLVLNRRGGRRHGVGRRVQRKVFCDQLRGGALFWEDGNRNRIILGAFLNLIKLASTQSDKTML
jgi:hypothetical protein